MRDDQQAPSLNSPDREVGDRHQITDNEARWAGIFREPHAGPSDLNHPNLSGPRPDGRGY